VNRRTRTMCLSILLAIAGLLTVSGTQAASLAQIEPPVTIYFFWGEGCPHCEEAKPFLEDLTHRYPQVQVESFEIYSDTDNQALFGMMAEAHGFEPRYVPTIFVGEEHWEGFADPLRDEIETAVQVCLGVGCPDAGGGIIPGHEATPSENGPADELGAAKSKVPVYLFWGAEGCPSCEATQPNQEAQSGIAQFGADSGGDALSFLRSLEAKHPDIELGTYEVWMSSANSTRFKRIAEDFGIEAAGVPTIFIGDRAWEGFSADAGDELAAYIQNCLDVGCPGPLDDESSVSPALTPAVGAEPTEVTPMSSEAADTSSQSPTANSITIPLLGTVDLGGQSLWTSTALISFADGFNPCSLWVLSILVALSLRSGSRKRIFTIGLIYITVTAGIYVLLIAGLFTFLTMVSFLSWIQMAVSILALFFAAINIKDYFWYKEGLSLTIADEKKPGIYKRVRKVMAAGDSFWALAGTTAALGAGVSLVEFSCTAGFPVVWTNLVAAQNVEPITFVLLLLLYMAIYQIDELAIFAVAVLTLKAGRMEEKHGRMLKLVGGMLMLMLAAVMLFEPALMNDLTTSLLIFGGALVAALAVLVIHRRLLPRLGIHIGTELSERS
jgi:thiol-disulfide isomerase/thioredoxin